MKTFAVHTDVKYWWRRDDEKAIDLEHTERLEEEAEAYIDEMRKEGFTCGELITEIEDVFYKGWWDVTKHKGK